MVLRFIQNCIVNVNTQGIWTQSVQKMSKSVQGVSVFHSVNCVIIYKSVYLSESRFFIQLMAIFVAPAL